MEKLDLKKELKQFYAPSAKEPVIVEVPALNYVMIDGQVEPGQTIENSPEFQQVMQALYGASYTLKFNSKLRKENPIDYGVMALEGLWWSEAGEFDITKQGNWRYTLMMLQPEHITPAMFDEALQQLRKKKPSPALDRLRFERFHEGLSMQIKRTTGWDLYAGLPLQHIAWLHENRPEVFAASRRFLFVNDFIAYRLTGRLRMNPSDASITQLMDIEAGDWDARLLALAGCRREQLSLLAPSGQVIGHITAAAAAETGLSPQTLVVNGAHDQYCAAVGTGVTSPGKMLLSCGTAWVLLAVPGSLEIGRQSGMSLSRHAIAGRWGAIRSLGGVGASLEWLMRAAWASESYAEMDAGAARAPLGANGLFCHPLSGGHISNTERGGFYGLTLAHTRDDLARAVMEGIDQGRQLDDVDDQAGQGRAADAAHGNHPYQRRERPGEEYLDEQRDCQSELPGDIVDQHGHESDHHARVNPVEQVRRPAGHELGQPRPTAMARFRAVEERFLGEIVGAAGTRIRVAARQLGEGKGG